MPTTVYRACPSGEATCGVAITTEGDTISVRGDDRDPDLLSGTTALTGQSVQVGPA